MYHHANAEKSALQFVEQFLLFVVVKFSMLLFSLTCLQNIVYHVVTVLLLSLHVREIYLHSKLTTTPNFCILPVPISMLQINILSELEASDRGYLSDKIIILCYLQNINCSKKSHI
jgi:hypothetical protein